MEIIKDIRLTPTNPRPGQPIKIEVLGNNGKPLNEDRFAVSINHIPASSAYTQFAVEGEHEVLVTAVERVQSVSNGNSLVSLANRRQRRTVLVSVTGKPSTIRTSTGTTLAILRAAAVPGEPYKAQLAIGASPDAKPLVGFSAADFERTLIDRIGRENTLDPEPVVNYRWNFGDGKTSTSASTRVVHDYSASVDPESETLAFTVSCTPLLANGTPHSAGAITRTLVFHSAYAILRKQGRIHPPVKSPTEASRKADAYRATVRVHNVEREIITVTHQSISAVGADQELIQGYKLRKLPRAITIDPGQSASLDVSLDVKQVPTGSSGIEARFTGTSKSKLPVRIATVIDLPLRDQPHLRQVAPQADEHGRIEALIADLGDECDPRNISAEDAATAVREGLTCQLTDETVTVESPARFANARKGDIVLSPGGNGLVGSLLAQIDPPQRYSHCGIMTRNFDEIAHSTASEERLLNHRDGPAGGQGLEEEALRYMWPGPITQCVDAALFGERWEDPDGVAYQISSFRSRAYDEDFVVTPPLVVKPDPLLETQTVRRRLHEVADEARRSSARPGEAAKGYYSLYCYSRARAGLDDLAPAAAEWAEGTAPSMCSSFIWLMARRTGVRLEAPTPVVGEADLETSDRAAGAEVSSETLDGLYHYDEWERQNAGEWLHGTVRDMVLAERRGSAVLGSPGRYASQLCNTFANGDSSRSARRSNDWENPGPGTTVSPDNLLLWDGPENNGLWGYAEPLLYVEPRRETVQISRWRRVIRTSTVSGSVAYSGRPLGRVTVTVGSHSAITSGDGRFSIPDVPYGPFLVRASHSATGTELTASRRITVNGPAERVDLTLEPPPAMNRLVEVSFDFVGVDDEVRADERETNRARFRVELNPRRRSGTVRRVYRWGGEVRVEYDFQIELLTANAISFRLNGKLFEGRSEDTDDLDDEQNSPALRVSADGSSPFFLRLYNGERRGGDWAEIRGTIRNQANVA